MDCARLREQLAIPASETYDAEAWQVRKEPQDFGRVRVTRCDRWLWVHAERLRLYAAHDEAPDSTSGDRVELEHQWDWVGPADSAPKSATVDALDAWAKLKTKYRRQNRNVDHWGSHVGTVVETVARDDHAVLRHASGVAPLRWLVTRFELSGHNGNFH